MNDGTTTGGRTESPANRERNRHGTDGVRGARAGDPLTTREYGTGTPRGGRRNQTDTGGRTYGDKGARGPGGATPQELGGLGLVPQGGSRDLGPTGCMDGRKRGGWGTPPHTQKGRQGQDSQGGPKVPRKWGGNWQRQHMRRRREEVSRQTPQSSSAVERPSPGGGGGDFARHCGAAAQGYSVFRRHSGRRDQGGGGDAPLKERGYTALWTTPAEAVEEATSEARSGNAGGGDSWKSGQRSHGDGGTGGDLHDAPFGRFQHRTEERGRRGGVWGSS